jgi:hypothetical protein
MDTMFDSAVRSDGDFAGVFEFDGETGYFYLYKVSNTQSNKILGAILITSSPPSFTESDIAVQWDVEERRVGLLIAGVLWAVFDTYDGAKFGGDFLSNTSPSVPQEVKKTFKLN